jgi:hypothetical protein
MHILQVLVEIVFCVFRSADVSATLILSSKDQKCETDSESYNESPSVPSYDSNTSLVISFAYILLGWI